MQWKPKIEFRDPKSLTPYVKNAKVHSTEQIDKIAGQIAAVGFTQPIVVDREGVIIAGHGRREAALRLALESVPVVVADHLDEYQAMAARIADNKVSDAPWDTELLKFDIGTLNLHGFNLDLTGFEALDLKHFLQSGEIASEMFGGPKTTDPVTTKEPATGSVELSEESFSEFTHHCPRCGFEFDSSASDGPVESEGSEAADA